MLWRSAVIGAVVGTVITAINQGDLVLRGQLPSTLLWKVPLTYAVPFVVATLGTLSGCLASTTSCSAWITCCSSSGCCSS